MAHSSPVEAPTSSSSSLLEPLTVEDPHQWCYFPVQHHDLHKFVKLQQSLMWMPEEIDLCDDVAQFDALDDPTKKWITLALSFFACSDGLVNQNLMQQFTQEIHTKEAVAFYAFQIACEQVHNEVYSNLIDRLLKADAKQKAFQALAHFPCILAKSKWAQQYATTELPLGLRLLAFAIVEGLFFSASFCAVYYLKLVRNVCPGLGSANEFISRDENLHYQFAINLYQNHIVNKVSQQSFHAMLGEAVATELAFVQDSLYGVRLIGMQESDMVLYVKHIANKICKDLNFSKLYAGAKNPFPFMAAIGLGAPKSNFFEKRETAYKKYVPVENLNFTFTSLDF